MKGDTQGRQEQSQKWETEIANLSIKWQSEEINYNSSIVTKLSLPMIKPYVSSILGTGQSLYYKYTINVM